MEMAEKIAAALIAEIERQTGEAWPVELGEDCWLVDAELNIRELSDAVLATLPVKPLEEG